MPANSWPRKHGVWIGWVVFLLALAGWQIGRSVYRAEPACDIFLAIALAAQVWLLVIQRDDRV